ALDPVRELKGGSLVAYRFARRVMDARSRVDLNASELMRLGRGDRLKIDFGVIVQGMNLLLAEPRSRRPPALIVPISFSSLSNVEDRARIVTALKQARSHVPQGVICE